MLSTEEFREFAKEVVPFAHVTTRIEGRKDEDLLTKKGGSGFPYIVAMDARGKVTAVLEGARTVAGFRRLIGEARAREERRAKPDMTAGEKFNLLLFDLKVGNLTVEDARIVAANIRGLGDAQKRALEGALLDREVGGILDAVTEGTLEERRAAGRAFAAMWKDGREPRPDAPAFEPFFILMLDHAEAAGDAKLFGRALGKLRDAFGDNPRAADFLKAQEERLQKLKGE